MNNIILEAQDLFFRYAPGPWALTAINLSLRRGEFFALLGANGAGKTTLLKNLNGLIRPQKGRVLLGGENIATVREEEVFKRVGLVMEDPHDQLFAPTVEEEVAFGLYNLGMDEKEAISQGHQVLEKVGLGGPLLKRAPHSLSFGQKKRLCIASVLALRPEVLLLDEPTAGLDPTGRKELMSLLKKLNREEGLTIVVATTSSGAMAELADGIAVLKDGQILSQQKAWEAFAEGHALQEAGLELPILAQLLKALPCPPPRLPLSVSEASQHIMELLTKER